MRSNEGNIAIYSRKSKFTGKGESIGNQVELCREYVRNFFGEEAAQGCVVFEDEGFSGGDLKRPSFQKMMEGVRRHQFQAIVVYRLDRISRNISDFTGLIDELTRLDVSFVSIREQFDTSTPMGRAMMFIISVFSQLERETIAERIRDNMHELAKTGRWLGGNTPTGYASQSVTSVTLDGKARKACHLKLIPEEGELVRAIFDLYTRTDSLTAVEAELLRRRAKTKRGNDFTRFSIKNILQNPVYMIADEDARNYLMEHEVFLFSEAEDFDGVRGMMAYNRTDQEKGKAAVILPMNEWIVAVGKHSGLIPGRQWVAVQNSLERNKSKSYRKPRSNEALLTGLLFCACGERMYPKLSKRTTASGESVCTYVCKMKERSKGERCDRRNLGGNALDAAIIQHIKSLPEHDSVLLSQLERSRKFYTGSREQYETQLTQLRTEFAENEKKLEGLIDSMGVLEGSPAKSRVVKRMEQLSDANCQIENRIRELEGSASEQTLCDSEFDTLRQTLSAFRTSIDVMSVEEKRSAIRTLVRRVIWDGETAHVLLSGADEGALPTHWCEDRKCYPLARDFKPGAAVDWRILEQISTDFYVLAQTQAEHVRYAPLYITSFPLNAPRKQLDAQLFQNRWGSYGAIDNIPDRLRWLRHSRGLMQKEVAQVAGVSRGVYIDLETGAAKQMPAQAVDKLARFYGVPTTDLLDAYSLFIQDDPASRLLHHRTQLGLTREAFAQRLGTSVRNLQMWETGKRTISYKSWERCFAQQK